MRIKLTIIAFIALAVTVLPSTPLADDDILAHTIGRLIIENTIGEPISPHSESQIRRFANNPEGIIEHNTQGHILSEKIRNSESRRRFEKLMEEQRVNNQ